MVKINLILLAAVLMFAALSGCNNNGSVTGPNHNANVSFSISQEVTQTGSMQFRFKPGSDIKISRLISRYPAEQFTDTLTYGNPNYIYSKDTVYIINNYINVVSGQQWIFDFAGSIPGSNSQYNVSANYTVQ